MPFSLSSAEYIIMVVYIQLAHDQYFFQGDVLILYLSITFYKLYTLTAVVINLYNINYIKYKIELYDNLFYKNLNHIICIDQ